MAELARIPAAALEQHIAMLGKTGAGKSLTSQGVAERLIEKRQRVCIIDPTDRYWGLRLLADGKNPSGYEPVIFGGQHGDLPLSATHGAAIAEIVGTTSTPVIIATRLMTVGERTRFFTDFAETLLRKNEGTLHLIIDEAHLMMPQQGAKVAGGVPAMLHAGNNLVSLGRGVGLRIMLLSQRPAKLHNDALGQVETLLAFRLILPHDRDAVRRWVREWADEATGAEMMASLPSLPTGTAWIWAPELDLLRKMNFPLPGTYDGGTRVAPGRKTPELKPIDLATVRGRLEIVAKEAVENDPRRLKARIAELERGVASNERAKSNAVPTVEIETAERRGYAAGRRDGWSLRLKAMLERHDALIAQGRRLVGDLEKFFSDLPPIIPEKVESVRRTPGGGPAAGELREGGARSALVKPSQPIPERSGIVYQQDNTPRNLSANSAALPRGERACLIAAAQHADGVSRAQMTVLTGYKRSTRDAYIARLREKDHIVAGDRIVATETGIAALGADYDPLPTGAALRELWLSRLPEGERRVLYLLIDAYPEDLPRTAIDEPTGYKRSTRDAYISRLLARELVEVSDGGVRASDRLFDAG